MLTLKNAMNAGTQLLNQQGDERIELVTSWTIPYQRFDGVMRHLNDTDHEIAVVFLNGFWETFTAVHDYAQTHGFMDDWQVQAAPVAPLVVPTMGIESI